MASKRTLGLVVQMSDSTIHLINYYPVDKYLGNQLRYPLDRDRTTEAIFAVIGHNTTNIPETFQVFMAFLVWL